MRNDAESAILPLADQYLQLLDYVKTLERDNLFLKTLIDPDSVYQGRPFFQVLYRMKGSDTIFFSPPVWMQEMVSGESRYTLQGASLSMKVDEYLERSKSLAFVVFKTYASSSVDDNHLKSKEDTLPLPDPESETVTFISREMIRALQNFFFMQPDYDKLFPHLDLRKEVPAPYLFWYCFRSSYETVKSLLSTNDKRLIQLFDEWVTPNHEIEYAKVDDQIQKGVISRLSMKYLVKPGTVLVSQKRGQLQAYMATSWATQDTANDKKWNVTGWSYEFDGVFYHRNTTLSLEMNAENPTEEVELQQLDVTPLEFASCEIRQKLEQRGKIYWQCRKRKFISYTGIFQILASPERFMIDFPTYLQLHADDKKRTTTLDVRQEMSPEQMDLDEPPSSPELFLFPSTVVGYNLRRKKWVNLEVDRIREIDWNKAAFESLVINRDAKELIQALVTNRLVAEKGTDMIEDKGNGLTILLHGGPGTGKTFTAESVAEFAEKPLYRVTCGDTGTLPEDVEQYLDSALHLGKIWDCVVLLDEADVFLEQRSLSDLQRNALVSVFLRLLEYYDGILILTTNRVGTFDEAFKSRIQLSLNYPPLTLPQRRKIWLNLINRLKRLNQPNIDFEDVECYIPELAEKDMNGRQIRNSITTARQLAKFKGRNMSYEDLKHVIGVASEFDQYLFEVKEKLTDDVIARESGLR
ncbi:P-loop containing nucleoside triphosphate hydrolase protein [Aspergillus sclerotiicarbonarius CBS 121057]|uniref:P-loop containing nucleoside triphosphate hydrolase protein n=1 Tax=Aspergillus sclerotiicarbonarius (strain CBS 121057 / IBT 28362) TaxID=1448318 RepID=A0A319E7R0_ASPSB|nr:P-loop containing nucleoside triphosphate hydrolase protein [Aspergillus sclerotiicarbonarius CBS 121057]